MASFTLRLDDTFKGELEKMAKRKNQSVNELIVNYLRLGKMFDFYTTEDSQVLIRNAKGFDKGEQIVVPIKEIVGVEAS